MELSGIAIAPNDEPTPFTRPLTEIEWVFEIRGLWSDVILNTVCHLMVYCGSQSMIRALPKLCCGLHLLFLTFGRADQGVEETLLDQEVLQKHTKLKVGFALLHILGAALLLLSTSTSRSGNHKISAKTS